MFHRWTRLRCLKLRYRIIFVTKRPFSLRPIKNLYWAYDEALYRRPLITKMTTAAVILCITDPTCQYLEHRHKMKSSDVKSKMQWNKSRTIKMVLGYAFWVTPFFNFGYKHILDRFFHGNSFKTVLKKIFVDAGCFAPISSTVFLSYGVIYDGGNKQMVIDKLRQDWWPLYSLGVSFIPLLQIINFRYVPSRYQILYLNGISCGWSIILSFYVNKEIEKVKE